MRLLKKSKLFAVSLETVLSLLQMNEKTCPSTPCVRHAWYLRFARRITGFRNESRAAREARVYDSISVRNIFLLLAGYPTRSDSILYSSHSRARASSNTQGTFDARYNWFIYRITAHTQLQFMPPRRELWGTASDKRGISTSTSVHSPRRQTFLYVPCQAFNLNSHICFDTSIIQEKYICQRRGEFHVVKQRSNSASSENCCRSIRSTSTLIYDVFFK